MKKLCKQLGDLYKNLTLPLKVSFWFFFCSVLQKGLSFLTTPIFTRMLSTDDYGMISVYNSWEQILMIFVTFSLSNSVFNVGLVKYSGDKDRFQTSMLGLSTVCAVFFTAMFLGCYQYIKPVVRLEYKYIVVMLIYCVFSSAIAMWSLRERFDYHYKRMLVVTILNTVLGPVLSILLVLKLRDKAFGKVLGIVLVSVIVGIFCYVDFLKKSGKFVNLKYWSFAFHYNFPMLPHFLASVFLNQIDRIMINTMCGAGQAGIYSVAYNSASIIYIINQALAASYNPWLLQRLKARNYSGVKEIVNAILICYFALLVLMILFAPEIMKLIATPDYYEGIYIIPPVAGSMYFILLFNLFAPVEHYSMKTKFMAAASVAAAVSNVVLNYFCIKSFGYLAAGYTTLACYAIYAAAHYGYMRQVCKRDLNNICLFSKKIILIMCIWVITVSILAAALYPYTVSRYLLILFILLVLILKRRSVIKLFSEFRSHR